MSPLLALASAVAAEPHRLNLGVGPGSVQGASEVSEKHRCAPKKSPTMTKSPGIVRAISTASV